MDVLILFVLSCVIENTIAKVIQALYRTVKINVKSDQQAKDVLILLVLSCMLENAIAKVIYVYTSQNL